MVSRTLFRATKSPLDNFCLVFEPLDTKYENEKVSFISYNYTIHEKMNAIFQARFTYESQKKMKILPDITLIWRNNL